MKSVGVASILPIMASARPHGAGGRGHRPSGERVADGHQGLRADDVTREALKLEGRLERGHPAILEEHHVCLVLKDPTACGPAGVPPDGGVAPPVDGGVPSFERVVFTLICPLSRKSCSSLRVVPTSIRLAGADSDRARNRRELHRGLQLEEPTGSDAVAPVEQRVMIGRAVLIRPLHEPVPVAADGARPENLIVRHGMERRASRSRCARAPACLAGRNGASFHTAR